MEKPKLKLKPVKHHPGVLEYLDSRKMSILTASTMEELAEYYGVALTAKRELYVRVPLGKPSRHARNCGIKTVIVLIKEFPYRTGFKPRANWFGSYDTLREWEIAHAEQWNCERDVRSPRSILDL